MKNTLFIEEIKSILPHRYPFLLVDRVVDVVPGKSGIGIKNVTVNEDFFNGHFPSQPVMPGVLILEAMAQTAVLVGAQSEKNNGRIVLLTGIDDAKFKSKVVPGDRLFIKVECKAIKGSFEKWSAKAFIDDALCASATLSAMRT
jgi:3-hydroxyacyl-[acyl-carrier-protein] dehydratase